jgi:hypothetical protein
VLLLQSLDLCLMLLRGLQEPSVELLTLYPTHFFVRGR